MIERALQIVLNAKDRLSDEEYSRLVSTFDLYSDFKNYDFNDAILTLLTKCDEADCKGKNNLHFLDEKHYTANEKLIPCLNSFGFDVSYQLNKKKRSSSLRLH